MNKTLRIKLKRVEMEQKEESMEVDVAEEVEQESSVQQPVTPRKTGVKKGCGAGPASTKKNEAATSKGEERGGKKQKKVVVSVETGKDAEEMTPGPVEAEAEQTEEQPEGIEAETKKKGRGVVRRAASATTESRRTSQRQAKLDSASKMAAVKLRTKKDLLEQEKFDRYLAQHPQPKQRSNLPEFTDISKPGTWERAIVDDWDCLRMYSRDVGALMQAPFKNVTVGLASREVTLAIGCLHIVHKGDPHTVCPAAQFASFGKMCCTTKGNLCKLGEEALTRDPAGYEQWVKPRAGWLHRVRDKGGEVAVESLGPSDSMNSLRLRAQYLVHFGVDGVKKYQEKIEEVFKSRIQENEEDRIREKFMQMRLKQACKRARKDKKLRTPDQQKARKSMPWYWTRATPENCWKALHRPRTMKGGGVPGSSGPSEAEKSEDEAVEGTEKELTPYVTPIASETDVATPEVEVLESAKKKRRLGQSPAGKSAQKQKPPKQVKPKTPFKLKIKMTPSQSTVESDELLARQLQERGSEEEEDFVTEFVPIPDADAQSTAGSTAGRKRRAATKASQQIRHQAEDEGSDATARESVTRDLFSERPRHSSLSSGVSALQTAPSASQIEQNLTSSTGMGDTSAAGLIAFRKPVAKPRSKIKKMEPLVSTSCHNTYQNATPSIGFMPRLDKKLFEQLTELLAAPLTDVETGIPMAETILHGAISEQLTAADQQARGNLGRTTVDIPTHLGDGLFQFTVTRAHISTQNLMPSQPTPLPRIHLANTPDYLSNNSRLYTTYGALTSQETASKIVVNDASLVMHQLVQQQRMIEVLLSLVESEDEEEVAGLREAVFNTKQVTERVSQRLADSASKTAIMAQYNRRWSLVQGAERGERKVVLCKPYVGCVTALGDPVSAHTTPSRDASLAIKTPSVRSHDSASQQGDHQESPASVGQKPTLQQELQPTFVSPQQQQQPFTTSPPRSEQQEKPVAQKTQEERVEEIENPQRAMKLLEILSFLNEKGAGAMIVTVAAPLTDAMCKVLNSAAGKRVTETVVIEKDNEFYEKLRLMPAAVFIDTEKAVCGGGSIVSSSVQSTPVKSQEEPASILELAKTLSQPGSTSGHAVARQQLELEKRRKQQQEELGAGDAVVGQRPWTPRQLVDQENVPQPYVITPTKSGSEGFPEGDRADALFPHGPQRIEPVPRSSTPLNLTTASQQQSLFSPTDSTMKRMFERVESQGSAATGASPVPSALNLTYSPGTREEIKKAYQEVVHAVTTSGAGMSEDPLQGIDETTTPAPTNTTDSASSEPRVSAVVTPTKAGPTILEREVLRTPEKETKRQSSREEMPPPSDDMTRKMQRVVPSVRATSSEVTPEPEWIAKARQARSVTPDWVKQTAGSSGSVLQGGATETSAESTQDEFEYDLNTTGSSMNQLFSPEPPAAREEAEEHETTLTPAPERSVVATPQGVQVTLTQESTSTTSTAPATSQTVTTQSEPEVETTVQMTLHSTTPEAAQEEVTRRTPPRPATPVPETRTVRTYKSGAARMWYTSATKSYELVVRCLKQPDIDEDTKKMLIQELGDYAYKREVAAANPDVSARQIKQEILEEIETTAREEAARVTAAGAANREALVSAVMKGIERRQAAGHSPLPQDEIDRRLAKARAPAPPPVVPNLTGVDVPTTPVEAMSREDVEILSVTEGRRKRGKTSSPYIPPPDVDVILLSDTEPEREEGELDEATATSSQPEISEQDAARLASDAQARQDVDYRLASEGQQDVDYRVVKQEH